MIINEILLKRKWIGHGGVWGILQVNSQNHGQFFFSTLENYEKNMIDNLSRNISDRIVFSISEINE